MATYNEPLRPAEFLISEADGTLSRDSVTILSGSGVIKAGMILGKITATGKYKPYDDDNADGSEVAAGIALMEVDATSADAACAVIARLAEVKLAALQFASTNDAGDQSAALVDLAAKFIIAR